MSNRGLRRTLIAAAVIGVVGLALVVVSGFALSAPYHTLVGAPPASLAVEDVLIPSQSGSTLRGWWSAGARGQGVIVLMHGVRADRRQMISRMLMLHELGYSLLAFDFQAHGESPGDRITFGHLEGLDAQAVVEFARRRAPNERLAVIGVSLGGAAALLAPKPLRIDALILESVYPDIDAATANRLESYLGASGRLLTPAYMGLMPLVLGFGPRQLKPVDRIASVRAPVLVMSGAEDSYTTITESRDLYEHAQEPKSFWAVPGAGHVDLFHLAPAEYRQHVLPFLAKYLQQSA